jgi:RNA polymerase sigma-70 factor (ECF subfamily)
VADEVPEAPEADGDGVPEAPEADGDGGPEADGDGVAEAPEAVGDGALEAVGDGASEGMGDGGGAAEPRSAARYDSAELVDGLVSGDPEAGNALFAVFGDRVNRLVWRLLGADRDHDDVVQQVFIAILESVERLRSPDALEAWITRVTVNTVRKEIRRRQRRRLWFSPSEPPDAPDPGIDSDERLVLRQFYRVLSDMRTDDRVVFTLRFVEAYTLPEIAAACDCSLATVKRRLTRARKRFETRARQDFVLAAALGAQDGAGSAG